MPASGWARRRTRALLAALAVAATLVVVATPAQAHNVLRSTDPADGSTVPTAPDHVTLTFDQPALALGTQIAVFTPDGRDAAVGDPELVDTTVTQAVGGALPVGTYTVEWRVTSVDGHPIDGTFTFVAAEAGGDAPTSAAPGSATPAPSATTVDDGPSGGGPAAWVVGTVLGGALVVLLVGLVVSVVAARRRRG